MNTLTTVGDTRRTVYVRAASTAEEQARHGVERARAEMSGLIKQVHSNMLGEAGKRRAQQRYSQYRYADFREQVLGELPIDPPTVVYILECIKGRRMMSMGTFGAWLRALVDSQALSTAQADAYMGSYQRTWLNFLAASAHHGYAPWMKLAPVKEGKSVNDEG